MDGIKSKERVQQHGEVFTPDSIVNDMLNLVDTKLNREDLESYRSDLLNYITKVLDYICKTYLEPSCGNGNFLIRILDRKLQLVQTLPAKYWELGLVKSVASIYGVDIQGDNVQESKERMIELIKEGTTDILELPDKEKQGFNFIKYELSPELERVIKFILDLNIKHGDCLTGLRHDVLDNGKPYESMIFTEYIWNEEMLTCKGHSLEDIKDNTDNDLFDNYGRQVHYTNIESLNFTYSDIFDGEEF